MLDNQILRMAGIEKEDMLELFRNVDTIEGQEQIVNYLKNHGAEDSEQAHRIEDWYRYLVLYLVSQGVRQNRKMATLALSTSKIDFNRWYS